MKSIKPGRGPSGMSFIASLVAIVIGLFWTVIAFGISSHFPLSIARIFPLFGIIFIVIGIVQAAYHYKNATGKERFSIFDITDSQEEGDPANSWIKGDYQHNESYNNTGNNEPWENDDLSDRNEAKHGYNYCPYCGTSLGEDYLYCPGCGKSIS